MPEVSINHRTCDSSSMETISSLTPPQLLGLDRNVDFVDELFHNIPRRENGDNIEEQTGLGGTGQLVYRERATVYLPPPLLH